jgi:hypothetical protein
MVRTLLIALLVFGMTACKDEKKEDNEEKEAAVDLSSADAAGKTIIAALKNDDKKTFQKCLSPRLQDKAKGCEGDTSERCQKRHSLDAMFNVWKNELPKMKDGFHESSLKEIDGKWYLNDS